VLHAKIVHSYLLKKVHSYLRKYVHCYLPFTTCRHLCTKSKNGRYIDRSEYANVIEANNRRVHEKPDYYRQRQQITEHQFGTLKRQRGGIPIPMSGAKIMSLVRLVSCLLGTIYQGVSQYLEFQNSLRH